MTDDLERICSFLRVGTDPRSACLASGMPEDQVAEWLEENAYWVKRAQAQFIVLANNRMMTEGGSAGARYLLDRFASTYLQTGEWAEESAEDTTDSDSLLDLLDGL